MTPSTERQTKELRKLRHSLAAKVARMARLAKMAVKKLIKLHSKIDKRAREIAGDDYKEIHEVGFVEYESMEKQRLEDDGYVYGPGLEDMHDTLAELERWSGKCASEPTPPQLPSE